MTWCLSMCSNSCPCCCCRDEEVVLLLSSTAPTDLVVDEDDDAAVLKVEAQRGRIANDIRDFLDAATPTRVAATRG